MNGETSLINATMIPALNNLFLLHIVPGKTRNRRAISHYFYTVFGCSYNYLLWPLCHNGRQLM